MDPQYAWIEKLDDQELYDQLKEHNINVPVTDTSRKLLRKRLAKVLGGDVPSSPDSSRPGLDDDTDAPYADRSYRGDDEVRRRGHKGNDTFGNSFFIEEVDASPVNELRARRASELEHFDEDLQKQAKLNKDLAGDDVGSSASRTMLTVLAIIAVIGVFLLISYMTQGESADELTKMPTVKVVPAEQAAQAQVPPVARPGQF